MVKQRVMVDSIAFIKLKVKYVYKDDLYLAESELTPLEYDSSYCLSEQYDWFDLAVKMSGINLLELDPQEFEIFKNSLDVELLLDDKINVCLN